MFFLLVSQLSNWFSTQYRDGIEDSKNLISFSKVWINYVISLRLWTWFSSVFSSYHEQFLRYKFFWNFCTILIRSDVWTSSNLRRKSEILKQASPNEERTPQWQVTLNCFKKYSDVRFNLGSGSRIRDTVGSTAKQKHLLTTNSDLL